MNFHGYPRTTGDMDIWVEPSNENALHLVKAIDAFGYDASPLLTMNFAEMTVFDIGSPPSQIEIMNHISGVTFAEAYPNRMEIELEGVHIALIHLNDLRLNKKAAARHKDLNDLEHLPDDDS